MRNVSVNVPGKISRWALAVLILTLTVLVGSLDSPPRLTVAPAEAQSGGNVGVTDRGPGMRRQALATLQFSVPKTFELSHLETANLATALGNNPERIFEFVRDNIAFEAYSGLLRGPYGTLLALAGNSLDRASLLAAMLDRAGQKVRYARGTLPELEARDLVTSMWAERPSALPSPMGAEDGAARQALETLKSRVRRDYGLIHEQIKKVKLGTAQGGPRLDDLVGETRQHYWVQWFRNGNWTDLDPSFVDASAGRTYTRVEETFDALPEALYHRFTLRIRIEEYAEAPSTRNVLTLSVRSADLSGRDLTLLHVPENWKGPADSIQKALGAAVASTGRIKPVLIIDTQRPVIGAPFRQKLAAGGMDSLQDRLRGTGSRGPATVATAEWLDIETTSPGGQPETVVREVFDLVGKSRRSSGRPLTPAEARAATEASGAYDATAGVMNILITTGRVDVAHVSGLSEGTATEVEAKDVRRIMRRISLTFVLLSDSILNRVGDPRRAVLLFYPDSPRVHIVQLYAAKSVHRVSLDLRRDPARAVAVGPRPVDFRAARILRGVINGTLERIVVEQATSALREKRILGPVMSTSLVFEQAQAERLGTMILTQGADLPAGLPPDTLARVREELAAGQLAIAPGRPVQVGDARRFAWWRVDPTTGSTTGVTDDGLHSSGSETTGQVGLVEKTVTTGALTTTQYWVVWNEGGMVYYTYAWTFRGAMAIVARRLAEGITWVGELPPSILP